MTKQYIGIIRDHSGSMYPLKNPAMKDYNTQLQSILQASKDFNIDTYVTSVICAGAVTDENINRPIQFTSPLNSYYAGGGTPLFDAINRTISHLQSNMDANDPSVSFLIQAITDGEENTSRISAHELSSKIRALQETDRWTFTFRVPKGYKRQLVSLLNIPEGNVIEWDQTEQGMYQGTVATSSAYTQYFTARSAGAKSTRGFYSDLSKVTSEQVQRNLTNVTNSLSVYSVDKDGEQISKFVERKTKKPFVKGTAYYELTKYERAIQEYKTIIIQDMKKGGFYSGRDARHLLGLPDTGNVSISPGDHAHYRIFVQSTSLNRKLVKGTSVLVWN